MVSYCFFFSWLVCSFTMATAYCTPKNERWLVPLKIHGLHKTLDSLFTNSLFFIYLLNSVLLFFIGYAYLVLLLCLMFYVFLLSTQKPDYCLSHFWHVWFWNCNFVTFPWNVISSFPLAGFPLEMLFLFLYIPGCICNSTDVTMYPHSEVTYA